MGHYHQSPERSQCIVPRQPVSSHRRHSRGPRSWTERNRLDEAGNLELSIHMPRSPLGNRFDPLRFPNLVHGDNEDRHSSSHPVRRRKRRKVNNRCRRRARKRSREQTRQDIQPLKATVPAQLEVDDQPSRLHESSCSNATGWTKPVAASEMLYGDGFALECGDQRFAGLDLMHGMLSSGTPCSRPTPYCTPPLTPPASVYGALDLTPCFFGQNEKQHDPPLYFDLSYLPEPSTPMSYPWQPEYHVRKPHGSGCSYLPRPTKNSRFFPTPEHPSAMGSVGSFTAKDYEAGTRPSTGLRISNQQAGDTRETLGNFNTTLLERCRRLESKATADNFMNGFTITENNAEVVDALDDSRGTWRQHRALAANHSHDLGSPRQRSGHVAELDGGEVPCINANSLTDLANARAIATIDQTIIDSSSVRELRDISQFSGQAIASERIVQAHDAQIMKDACPPVKEDAHISVTTPQPAPSSTYGDVRCEATTTPVTKEQTVDKDQDSEESPATRVSGTIVDSVFELPSPVLAALPDNILDPEEYVIDITCHGNHVSSEAVVNEDEWVFEDGNDDDAFDEGEWMMCLLDDSETVSSLALTRAQDDWEDIRAWGRLQSHKDRLVT